MTAHHESAHAVMQCRYTWQIADDTCAACNLGITEASLLGGQQIVVADAVEVLSLEPLLGLVELTKLAQEPRVNLGVLKDGLLRHAILHCLHRNTFSVSNPTFLHLHLQVDGHW